MGQKASGSQTPQSTSAGIDSLKRTESYDYPVEEEEEQEIVQAHRPKEPCECARTQICDCCGCKEILNQVVSVEDSKKICLCRDIIKKMTEKRESSSSSSSSDDSDSSSSSSYRSCTCCKRKNVVRERQLYALRKKLSDQSYPLCSPCYKQNQRGFYPQNYMQNPAHICRCYSVVQTSTLNEVKQTIYDLNMIQNSYCDCSDATSCCSSRRCNRNRKRNGKKGVAYMLTFEDGSVYEEPSIGGGRKHRHLEEIKIKVPTYKKKHKDKHNNKKKRKKKDNKRHQKTLQVLSK